MWGVVREGALCARGGWMSWGVGGGGGGGARPIEGARRARTAATAGAAEAGLAAAFEEEEFWLGGWGARGSGTGGWGARGGGGSGGGGGAMPAARRLRVTAGVPLRRGVRAVQKNGARQKKKRGEAKNDPGRIRTYGPRARVRARTAF